VDYNDIRLTHEIKDQWDKEQVTIRAVVAAPDTNR